MLAPITRSVETEEERRRKAREAAMLLARPAAIPEPAPVINETEITRRPVAPVTPIPEPLPAPGSFFDPNAPMVVHNNRAKPIGVEGGGDELTRNQALLKAQESYQAPISKKDIAVKALLGFLDRGVGGAIGNVAQYTLDPISRNQTVMGGDISRTKGLIHRDMTQRNVQNEWANDQSARGYKDAQSKELISRASRPVGFNLSPGQTRYENGKPVVSLPPITREPREPPGFTLAPGQIRYGPDGKPIATAPDRPDKPGDDNSQIEAVIREAQTERDRIGASLKDVPSTITVPGAYEGDPPKVGPNPVYTDLMSRYRQLDDQIRDWRVKVKPKTPITRSGSGGGRWSASRWAAANQGGDVNAAKAAAKAKGYVIVD